MTLERNNSSKQPWPPPKGPFLGTSHYQVLGTERSFPWATCLIKTVEAQGGQIYPEATAFSKLTSRPWTQTLALLSKLAQSPSQKQLAQV